MSDLERRPNQDREDDRDIRALMRETDYSGRLRDDFKRELLREINHNFRYHTLRSRILPVAVMVLIAVSATWWTTDGGGDGFNLRPTGQTVDDGVVVEAPMTRTRFNIQPESNDIQEDIASAEGVYAQLAAGDAKVVRLETWTIGEDTIQFVWLEVRHDGQVKNVVRAIGSSSKRAGCIKDFRSGSGRAMLKAIDGGSITPQSTETMRALGRDFEMGVWTWETAECGQVLYKKSMR